MYDMTEGMDVEFIRSCDTDTEVMCNENKGQVSSFKSLLLACQVCILFYENRR